MESRGVQQALILKIKLNCMENELAWIKERLAEIEEEEKAIS